MNFRLQTVHQKTVIRMMENATVPILFGGMEKCLRNATDLYDEAEILLNKGRYLRGFTLAQLCIEETGKALQLFYVCFDLINGDRASINFKKVIKDFRDHKSKTYQSTLADFMSAAKKTVLDKDALVKELLEEIDQTDFYNTLKNDSLYVGYESDKGFYAPADKITEGTAQTRVAKAKERLDAVAEDIGRNIRFLTDYKIDFENSTSWLQTMTDFLR